MPKVERWFEVFKGKDGMWWWRYNKRVGGVINIMAGPTEGYHNKKDCLDGILEIRECSNEAEVREV
jgi:uncharacterized protein YegP (UPF0339 family)